MTLHTEMVADALREHLGVCDELLRLAQEESDALRNPAPFPTAKINADRNNLLVRLDSSLRSVAAQRERWHQLRTPGSEADPELAELAQGALDTIMRLLVMDRENEQNLLRRGLLPARSLPRAEQSRPHFVARMYQRHALS
jgi:hypothetical protein